MSQIIKKAIVRSFVKLLNQYPMDKISVTELAKETGISRRTFYSYFHDLNQLPEELFLMETKKTMGSKPSDVHLENYFIELFSFAFQNKKAILHIYHSTSREHLERYIYNVAEKAVADFVSFQAKSTFCSTDSIEKISAFYTGAIVSLSMEWIHEGMNKDPELIIRDFAQIMRGTIQSALKNCSANICG